MSNIAALLPIGFVACTAYAISARGWRLAMLTAFAIGGSFVVVTTESLSAFHGISRGPVVLVWALALVASALWAARTRGQSAKAPTVALTGVEWLLCSALLLIALLTLTTATLSAPNTW